MYTPEEKQDRDRNYFNLIKLLIQRYFRSKTALEARALPSAELVSSLGEEVDELKILIDEVIDKVRGPSLKGGNGGGNRLNVPQDTFTKSRRSLPVVHEHEKWKLQSPRKSAPTITTETNTSFPKIPEPPPKELKHATTVASSDHRKASVPVTSVNKGIQNEETAQNGSNKNNQLTSKSVPQHDRIKGLSSSSSPLSNVTEANATQPEENVRSVQKAVSDGAAQGSKKPIGKDKKKTEKPDETGAKPVQAILPPLPPLPPGAKSSETLVKPGGSPKK